MLRRTIAPRGKWRPCQLSEGWRSESAFLEKSECASQHQTSNPGSKNAGNPPSSHHPERARESDAHTAESKELVLSGVGKWRLWIRSSWPHQFFCFFFSGLYSWVTQSPSCSKWPVSLNVNVAKTVLRRESVRGRASSRQQRVRESERAWELARSPQPTSQEASSSYLEQEEQLCLATTQTLQSQKFSE